MTLIQINDTRTLDLNVRFSEKPSKQDMADCISYHLGTMKEQSRAANPKYSAQAAKDNLFYNEAESHCVYRRADGNSCAFGYVLRDDEYVERMENLSVDRLIARGLFPRRLMGVSERMFEELQRVHDAPHYWNRYRADMRIHLSVLYAEFDLDPAILDHPDMAWNKAP